MSLYNMLNGISPLTIFLIPMLGDKHPDEYPRFRNVFLDTADDEPKYNQDIILVYTRVGGGNRGCGYGEKWLLTHPNFIDTFDDSLDSTYGNYVFSVPNEFKKDYNFIKKREIEKISNKLLERCYKIFPSLKDLIEGQIKDIIDRKNKQKKTKE